MAKDFVIDGSLRISSVDVPNSALNQMRRRIKDIEDTRVTIRNVAVIPSKAVARTFARVLSDDISDNLRKRPIILKSFAAKVPSSVASSVSRQIQKEINDKVSKTPIRLSKFLVTPSGIKSIASQITRGLNQNGITIDNFNFGKSNQRESFGSRTTTTSNRNALSGTRQLIQANQTLAEKVEVVGEQVGVTLRRFAAYSVAYATFATVERAVFDAASALVEFDKQANRLGQTLKVPLAAAKEVTDEIRRLSTSYGVSSQELAKASVQLAQAGIPLKETKAILQSLADTDLSPSFDSIEQTTEGIIALRGQFKQSADEISKSLSTINSLAAAYPVESADFIEAIRRAGGTFVTANGSLEELLSTFTAVRSTTRLSAATIATAFNTIFSRLQSPAVRSTLLGQFNIDLRDATSSAGQLVSPLEQIRRLADGLRNLPATERFAALFEVAGQRQLNKIIPLINNVSLAEEAYGLALSNSNSLILDRVKAQERLEVRLAKTKESIQLAVAEFFQAPVNQTIFDVLIKGVTAFGQAIRGLSPLLGVLTPLLSVYAAQAAKPLVRGFLPGLSGNVIGGFFGGGFRKIERGGPGQTFNARQLVSSSQRPDSFLNPLFRENLLSGRLESGVERNNPEARTLFNRSRAAVNNINQQTILKNKITDAPRALSRIFDQFNSGNITLNQAAKAQAIVYTNTKRYQEQLNLLQAKLPLTIKGVKGFANSLDDIANKVRKNETIVGGLRRRANQGRQFLKNNAGDLLTAGGLAATAFLDTDIRDRFGEIKTDAELGPIQTAKSIQGASFLGLAGRALGLSPIKVALFALSGALTSLYDAAQEITQARTDKKISDLSLSLTELIDSVNTSGITDKNDLKTKFREAIGPNARTPADARASAGSIVELFRQTAIENSDKLLFNSLLGKRLGSPIQEFLGRNSSFFGSQEKTIQSRFRTVDFVQSLSKQREIILRSGLAEGTPQGLVESGVNQLNLLIAKYTAELFDPTQSQGYVQKFVETFKSLNEGSLSLISSINRTDESFESLASSLVSTGKALAEINGKTEAITSAREIRQANSRNFLNSVAGESFSEPTVGVGFRLPNVFEQPLGQIEIARQIASASGNPEALAAANQFGNILEARSQFRQFLERRGGAVLSQGNTVRTGENGEQIFAPIQREFLPSIEKLNIPQELVDSLTTLSKQFLEQLSTSDIGAAANEIFEPILEGYQKYIDAVKNARNDNLPDIRAISQAFFDEIGKVFTLRRDSVAANLSLSLNQNERARARVGLSPNLGLIRQASVNLANATAGRTIGSPQQAAQALQQLRDRLKETPAGFEAEKTSFQLKNLQSAIKELSDSTEYLSEIQRQLGDLESERANILARGEDFLTNESTRKNALFGAGFLNQFAFDASKNKRVGRTLFSGGGLGFNESAFQNYFAGLSDEQRRAVIDSINSPENRNRALNIGGGRSISAQDLIPRILKQISVPFGGKGVTGFGLPNFDAAFGENERKRKELESLEGGAISEANEFRKALEKDALANAGRIADALQKIGENISSIVVPNANIIVGNGGFAPAEIPRKMRGGPIYNNGRTFAGRDSQLIAAEPGEFVVRKSVAQRNLGLLSALNSGVQGFANGGVVNFSKNATLLPNAQDIALARALLDLGLDDSESFIARAVLRKAGQDTASRSFTSGIAARADKTLEQLALANRPTGPGTTNFVPDTAAGRARQEELAKLKQDNQRIRQGQVPFDILGGIGNVGFGILSGIGNALLNPIDTVTNIGKGLVNIPGDIGRGLGTTLGGAFVGDLGITKEGLNTLGQATVGKVLGPAFKAIGSTIEATTGKSVTGRRISTNEDLTGKASENVTNALLFYLGLASGIKPLGKVASIADDLAGQGISAIGRGASTATSAAASTASTAASASASLAKTIAGVSGPVVSGVGRGAASLAKVNLSPVAGIRASIRGSRKIQDFVRRTFVASPESRTFAERLSRASIEKSPRFQSKSGAFTPEELSPSSFVPRDDIFDEIFGLGIPTTASRSILNPPVIALGQNVFPQLGFNRNALPFTTVGGKRIPLNPPKEPFGPFAETDFSRLRRLRRNFDIIKGGEDLVRIAEKYYPNNLSKQGDFIAKYHSVFPPNAQGIFSNRNNIGGVNLQQILSDFEKQNTLRHEIAHGYNKFSGLREAFSKGDPELGRAFDEISANLIAYRREVKLGNVSKFGVSEIIKSKFNKRNYNWMTNRIEKFRDKVLQDYVLGEFTFNRGGFVGGAGEKDSVRAKLTPGEFVVNRNAATKNAGLLSQINSGAQVGGNNIVVPHFDIVEFAQTVKKLDIVANKLASIPSIIDVKIAPVQVSISGLNLQNIITQDAISKIAAEVYNKMTGEDIRRKLTTIG